jgi:hypothetical protein
LGEKDELIEDLARGFSSEYMDAEGTVGETVSELREYMDLYSAAKGHWVAPYTSFVTSSMMGKSRHMKEVANNLPSVYICLRGEVRGYGYPRRSPSIAEWSLTGAATILEKPVREYHSCFSTFRWSAFIVSTIYKLATWIDDGRFFTSLGINDWKAQKLEFAWLWKFFAEPPNSCKLQDFWHEVQKATSSMLLSYPDGISAHTYFQKGHASDVENALKQLRRCFARHQIDDNSLPLIMIYDEARTLCDHEAYNGTRIYEEHAINFHEPKEPPKYVRDNAMPFRSFSNFRALRRALRYLSARTSDVPRIFAVFTDTTSRITNFQPTSWNDPSLRVPSLPGPGEHQFPPIFVFSSVDVYSRVLNDPMCISNPEYVADPNRLLKFGRAGWYSAYFHGNASRKANLPQSYSILSTATSKLLSTSDLHLQQNPFNAHLPLTPANLIKLIAVLAPRLALTIGPYTLEASELIASHLAVLTKTDDERHFLRTVYPSEPILAEVSARLTHTYGWANPLSALVHYVQGGIVEAGFKGELITKIVCLMAMDKALSQIPVPENRWQYSRPIPVSDFLNHLIAPLRGYSTFSEGLKGVQDRDNILRGTLNIDDKKLQRFLRGYVFFNHFIRVDVKLSYAMLVHAWNRGAAIMCMTNTKGIGHVIPVMLDTNGDVIFGPLHGPWEKEHIQQARQHISYILINSKNYASGQDQIRAAWAAKFSARNLREYGDGFQSDQATEADLSDETENRNDETLREDLDADSLNVAIGTDEEMKDAEMHELEMDNVFLSVVQDFGNKRLKEPCVAVGKVLKAYTHPRGAQPLLEQPPLDTQFIVVLKGIGADTYECLKNSLQEPEDSASNQLRSSTRRYLKELTSARVDYVDKNGKRKRVAGMQNLPLVYGDFMLGSENWVRCRPALQDRWRAEQEAFGGAVESWQPPTDVVEDGSMDEVEIT